MRKPLFNKDKKYIIPVIFTPCSSPGVIDEIAIEKFCSRLYNIGCDAIFAIGSTGCMPVLDETDRIKIVLSANKGKTENSVLLAGISGTGVKNAIKNAKQMADSGADAGVIMPPFFLNFNQEQLYAYICEIADNSPLPVVIYNHLRMPTIFEVLTVSKLAKHPNIIGMKDTGLDMEKQKGIISAVENEDFVVFQGHERLILESLQAGANGCMTALANIVPDWHQELIKAYCCNDIDLALHYQTKLTQFTEKMLMDNEVRQSWGHFEYSLKYCAEKLGLLEKQDSFIKGWSASKEFGCYLDKILSEMDLI